MTEIIYDYPSIRKTMRLEDDNPNFISNTFDNTPIKVLPTIDINFSKIKVNNVVSKLIVS
jgi:hypothetical protein